MKILLALPVMILLAAPVCAEVGDLLVDNGETNPEEQTLKYFSEKYDFKFERSTACTYGYWAAKSGHHKEAKIIFDKCVAAGVDGAYPWQSYLSQNGFGTRQSPEDAAEWDRKSAARGYKVGQFNYGLDLLRGFGAKQDIAAGRALIDAAAEQGLDSAQRLKDADYDTDVVVPDADEQRVY